MRLKKYIPLLSVLLCFLYSKSIAQNNYELNSGWKCRKAADVYSDGSHISTNNFKIASWENATVPGTVLTTQINNKEVPDPFYGMNNEQVPDIYKVGRDYYTYWFVKDFNELKPLGDDQVYLNF